MHLLKDFAVVPITFSSSGCQLTGFLHLPPDHRPPVIIGSHGIFSDGDSPKQITLAAACNQLGLAYFRFHHRGCGKSSGRFTEVTSLTRRCDDLIAAIETVTARMDIGSRFAIFGSSMGGATAIALTKRLQPDALVTLAAPVRSAPILEIAQKTAGGLRGLPLSFYQACLSFDLSDQLGNLSHILVIHGEDDDIVPVTHADEIYSKAREPKKRVIHPHGDHQVSDLRHQRQFIRDTAEWFRYFL